MKPVDRGQAWSYIIFGILTTIVNFVSYVIFTKLMDLDYKTAASLAWLVSVIFAFVTNKLYVFKTATTKKLHLLKELSGFIFFRVLSYFVDIGSIIVLVEVLNLWDTISKIIASAIVAVFNYFASKYIIFRTKGT